MPVAQGARRRASSRAARSMAAWRTGSRAGGSVVAIAGRAALAEHRQIGVWKVLHGHAAKFDVLAERRGYFLSLRNLVYRNGWPQDSARPYQLSFAAGTHIASYATLAKLEDALRCRTGD